MTGKRKAQIVLAVLGLGLALLLGQSWGTNDKPLWLDLASFIALVVLIGVISRVVEWAMNALNREDEDR